MQELEMLLTDLAEESEEEDGKMIPCAECCTYSYASFNG